MKPSTNDSDRATRRQLAQTLVVHTWLAAGDWRKLEILLVSSGVVDLAGITVNVARYRSGPNGLVTQTSRILKGTAKLTLLEATRRGLIRQVTEYKTRQVGPWKIIDQDIWPVAKDIRIQQFCCADPSYGDQTEVHSFDALFLQQLNQTE